jgi:hypothetical protein
MNLRALDLFSGIGGFTVALKPLTTTVAYCDIEESCRVLLKKNISSGNLDDAHIFENVKDISNKAVRALRPDIITAGFPCTDISVANVQGVGITGERSGLFFEIMRLVDAANSSIKYIYLENSHAIVNRGLDIVLNALHSRGFCTSWCMINASDVGALHRRKRWYCLAYKPKHASKLQLLPLERMQYAWTKEPCKRIVRKPSDRDTRFALVQRCKMLGNSIVPQCASYAWNCLVRDVQSRSRSSALVSNQVSIVPIVKKRDLKLVVTDGTNTFKLSSWGTPCYSIWHIYSHITSARAKTVLTVQIFYEQKTLINLRCPHGKNKNKTEEYRKYLVNPKFIEFLMGYPLDWTSLDTQ